MSKWCRSGECEYISCRCKSDAQQTMTMFHIALVNWLAARNAQLAANRLLPGALCLYRANNVECYQTRCSTILHAVYAQLSLYTVSDY